MSASAESTKPYLTITPPGGWQPINFAELWAYRDMVWRMTLRDIKSRYKQSALGPTWVIIIPLFQAGLFSVIFGTFAGMPSGGVAYPIFAFVGMLVWNQFNRAFGATGGCIAANENLITKVYFPRLVAPIASVAGSVLDLLLGLVVMAVIFIIAGIVPTWHIIFAPLFIILAMATAMGLGIWVASFSVKFRDFRYAAGFLGQFYMWLSPVAYSSEAVLGNERVPESIRPAFEFLFQLNPMFVAVEGFRWSTTGYDYGEPTWITGLSVAITLVILVTGLYYFRRVDSTVADIV